MTLRRIVFLDGLAAAVSLLLLALGRHIQTGGTR
jgi:hypothetical protein